MKHSITDQPDPSSRMTIATTIAVLSLCFVPAAFPQSVSGRVTERTSGAPVRSAGLVLFDSKGHVQMAALADSAGHYRITTSKAGSYTLKVNGPGLATLETAPIQLTAGSESIVDVTLSLGATKLDNVVVTGKKVVDAPPGNRHKYDQFLLRRQLGIGTFITREQIESHPAAHTPAIFSQIAGLKVRQFGTEWDIRSQRCPAKLEGGSNTRSMDDDDPTFPMLFIDGMRVKGLSFLNSISPAQIEGIEVYQGAAQLPPEAKGNACAAIFIWLK